MGLGNPGDLGHLSLETQGVGTSEYNDPWGQEIPKPKNP